MGVRNRAYSTHHYSRQNESTISMLRSIPLSKAPKFTPHQRKFAFKKSLESTSIRASQYAKCLSVVLYTQSCMLLLILRCTIMPISKNLYGKGFFTKYAKIGIFKIIFLFLFFSQPLNIIIACIIYLVHYEKKYLLVCEDEFL